MDWAYFIDVFGCGMHYSKQIVTSNAQDIDWCATCLPESFVRAAVQTFPDDVIVLTEAEWEKFYDEDVHFGDETEHLDVATLQGILARVQLEALGIAPPPSDEILALRKQCLDPECIHKPGIRKNMRKTWKQFKELKQITIKNIL